MHLQIFQRAWQDCASGTQFYNCAASNCQGCFTFDACNVSTCPPGGSQISTSAGLIQTSSSNPEVPVPTASPTSSTTPPSSGPTTSPESSPGKTATVTITSSTTAPFSSFTTSLSIPGITPVSSFTSSSTTSSFQTPVPTVPQASTQNSSSKPSLTPILAGAVSGVVGISILAVLIWFCCRRRKQKKQIKIGPSNQYSMPRKYFQESSLTPQARLQKDGDVFADFGGPYNTPPPAIPGSNPSNTISVSHEEDEVPLHDPEKSSRNTSPPPLSEHPAYHLLPGQSPEIPTYVPGQPSYSPPMTQHPAYHVSQLSSHPAFASPSSSPRSANFPIERSSEVRMKSSPRNGGRAGPMDIAPIIPSAPSERLELEAEVPSLASPIASPNQQLGIQTQYQAYNPQHYAAYQVHLPETTFSPSAATQHSNGLGINPALSSQTQKHLSVLSPQSAISPQSPFHLDTQYSHLSSHSSNSSMKKLNDMIEGKEKECVVTSSNPSNSPGTISPNPVSPSSTQGERWSGATATEIGFGNAGEMAEFNVQGKGGRIVQLNGKMVEFKPLGEDGGKTPISATESPGEEFRTWESWAQR